MASKGFVDFAEIKRVVSLEQVLGRYKVLDSLSGAQRKGPNPFDRVAAGTGKTFAANLDKNVWTLFRSEGQLSGNVIDFVMHKEGCDVRQAALKLAEWFALKPSSTSTNGAAHNVGKKAAAAAAPPSVDAAPASAAPKQIAFNPPLGFQLRGLDAEHPALERLLYQWGISRERVAEFGAGYYSGKGKAMHGRLAVPIEREGVLVGYCGIAVNDEDPLFKFPDNWIAGVEIYNLTNAIKAAEEARENGEWPQIIVYRNILQVWQSKVLNEHAAVAVLGGGLTVDQLIWLYLQKVPQRFPMAFHLHDGGPLL
jgi:hypothetical protein